MHRPHQQGPVIALPEPDCKTNKLNSRNRSWLDLVEIFPVAEEVLDDMKRILDRWPWRSRIPAVACSSGCPPPSRSRRVWQRHSPGFRGSLLFVQALSHAGVIRFAVHWEAQQPMLVKVVALRLAVSTFDKRITRRLA